MPNKINLKQVAENSFYCDGYFAVGVYRCNDNGVVLIDSGVDKNLAKLIDKALRQEKLTVHAIINTHCHGEHCGGNAYFQQQYPELQVYATVAEQRSIECPDHGPTCFCGNAAPFIELKKTKQVAPQQPSIVTDPIKDYTDQTISIAGSDFRIVTLPGHTPGMIGVITPDQVLYTGDAVFGDDTFVKHSILFYTDVTNTLASFEKLKGMNIVQAVLYHGGYSDNLQAIASAHQGRIMETMQIVEGFLQQEPLSIEQLTQKVMQKFSLPENVVSFTLTKTAITAYISYLQSNKQLELIVKDGLLMAKLEPGNSTATSTAASELAF